MRATLALNGLNILVQIRKLMNTEQTSENIFAYTTQVLGSIYQVESNSPPEPPKLTNDGKNL